MAIFGSVSEDYTKTDGKGFFAKASNFVSYFPLIGGALAFPLGMVDTVIQTGKWAFQGKFASAATALAAGTVGATVNSIPGVSWWVNDISGVTTGATAGTHARAATEALLSGGFKMLGQNPAVTASYPAGIGSIGSSVSGPGKFASDVSAQRGQNADAAYQRYMNGDGGAHVNELQSANGRGA